MKILEQDNEKKSQIQFSAGEVADISLLASVYLNFSDDWVLIKYRSPKTSEPPCSLIDIPPSSIVVVSIDGFNLGEFPIADIKEIRINQKYNVLEDAKPD